MLPQRRSLTPPHIRITLRADRGECCSLVIVDAIEPARYGIRPSTGRLAAYDAGVYVEQGRCPAMGSAEMLVAVAHRFMFARPEDRIVFVGSLPALAIRQLLQVGLVGREHLGYLLAEYNGLGEAGEEDFAA